VALDRGCFGASRCSPALILLLILLACRPGHAGSPYPVEESGSGDAAQSAYAAGRFIDALRIWRPLAEGGDGRAAFKVGLLYDLGEGVGPDAATAYMWYRRAAETGYVLGEFNLAVMLDSGTGVTRNLDEAALWYSRAAAHGYARAEYNLAQLYENGEGAPRNLDVAASWYAAAERHGLSAAARRLERIREETRQAIVSPVVAVGAPSPIKPAEPSVALVSNNIERTDVELSWIAPPQVVPVEYFVQVLALDARGDRRVFASASKLSAMLVSIPRGPVEYAWRVYTIAASIPDYVPSAWGYFAGH
jgi:TPR repeat protein